MQLEDRSDPHQPQRAHAYKAYHHGQYAVAQPAQAAGQHVHDAAQQVKAADQAQPLGTGGNDRCVRGIEAQQLVPRQRCAAAQHKAGDHGTQQTVADYPVKVVVFARADILAGKGDGGLRKGVHSGVHKALQIGGGRVARHHHGAEGVDGRLDDHVGKTEHRALQPGRQADEQNLLQRSGVEGQPPQVQPQRALLPDKHSGHQQCGHGLADDGGQCHARHAHGKADDEDQIQHHVDDTGSGQTIQRALGVAHGPQQRTAEVVQHGHGHADKIDLQVQGRKADHVLRAAHQLQQAARGAKAHHRQQNAADQTQRHGSVHRILHAFFILCAKAPGSHHVGAQRKPDKQVDQQVDQ